MQFSTTHKQLLNAIILVEKNVGKKESLPVLSCVVCKAENGVLTLQTTNLESSMQVIVPAQITTDGTVAVNAHIFSQIIRSIQGETIHCEIQDENLTIKSKNTNSVIKSIPYTEFPFILTHATLPKNQVLDKTSLLTGIRSVVYAASSSMIRPELGSIYISFNDTECVCVATDSFRLAEKTLKQTVSTPQSELLIPLKYTLELMHVLEHIQDESVEWSVVEDSYVVFKTSEVYYMTRIVDSRFPQYKEIIPKDVHTEVTLLKNDFADVLRKARIFSGTDQYIGIHVYPKKKICTATAQSALVGEMSDSLDGALSGEDIDIKFHITYLADCLSSIASDSIVLTFAGVGRPVLIHGVSDPSFRYLVMPLNR